MLILCPARRNETKICAVCCPLIDCTMWTTVVVLLSVASLSDCFSVGLVTGGIYQQGMQPLSSNGANIFCEFQQLGVKWTRIQSDWFNTSTQTYQTIVKQAHQRGIKVVVIVPARYCGNDTDNIAIDQFTEDYVRQLDSLVSNTFNGMFSVDAYEIGNELNQVESGCGDGITRFRVSPNAFAWLLRRVYQWKQAKNRPEMIVSGGLINTYTTESFWPPFFGSGAFFAFPNTRPFDLFGIHPYNPFSLDRNCTNSLSTDCFSKWQQSIVSGLQAIQSKLDAVTKVPGTTMFVTEIGIEQPVPSGSTCPEVSDCVQTPAQQASGMIAAFSAIQQSGVVPFALWYDYRDDTQEHFGLRGLWNGTAFPVNQPAWSQFQSIAGGSNPNPDACW